MEMWKNCQKQKRKDFLKAIKGSNRPTDLLIGFDTSVFAFFVDGHLVHGDL